MVAIKPPASNDPQTNVMLMLGTMVKLRCASARQWLDTIGASSQDVNGLAWLTDTRGTEHA